MKVNHEKSTNTTIDCVIIVTEHYVINTMVHQRKALGGTTKTH